MEKKGVSGVVTALILIALVLVATTIVWGVINKIVKKELATAESCFGIFDKVSVNNDYTCHNSSSQELRFGISMGDINVDELLVSISGVEQSRSFKLSNEASTESYIRAYTGGDIVLPSKNAGLTYIVDLTLIRLNESGSIATLLCQIIIPCILQLNSFYL